jgi:hypothetical protein
LLPIFPNRSRSCGSLQLLLWWSSCTSLQLLQRHTCSLRHTRSTSTECSDAGTCSLHHSSERPTIGATPVDFQRCCHCSTPCCNFPLLCSCLWLDANATLMFMYLARCQHDCGIYLFYLYSLNVHTYVLFLSPPLFLCIDLHINVGFNQTSSSHIP